MSQADPIPAAPQTASPAAHKQAQSLHTRKAQLLIACALTASICSVLYLSVPYCNKFWLFSLQGLLNWLTTPEVQVSTVKVWHALEAPLLSGTLPPPDYHAWIVNLAGGALLYLLAGLLSPLLRTSLRALAVFHVFGVLLQGLLIPYTLQEHTLPLSIFNLGLLLCLPIVMAATHYIVERNLERRILATVLIAGFLIFSLPFKLAAHLSLLQFLSPLAMPSLFLVFGPALDILCVSALYAWAVTWRNKRA